MSVFDVIVVAVALVLAPVGVLSSKAVFVKHLTERLGVSGCIRAFAIAIPVASVLLVATLFVGWAMQGYKLVLEPAQIAVWILAFLLLLWLLSAFVAVLVGYRMPRQSNHADRDRMNPEATEKRM